MNSTIKYFVTVFLLAGCASNNPLPPATPVPLDIQAAATSMDAVTLSAGDYYTYGTTLAARNCNGWFSAQMASASQNSALSSELGILGAAAGAAGGPIGAGAAAAAGFGAATVGNLQANSNAGIDPTVTYGLVRKVQQTWLAGAVLPTTKAEAYMLVEDFSEKCQLPEIKKAVADAVSTAPVRLVPTALTARLFGQPVRVLPPVVLVGGQQE